MAPNVEVPVQLADILARLSPDERGTLLDRRLGPNAVPLDNRALAGHLATAASTHAALAQINGGQLLLLRWLAERKNLHASWSELTAAIGDRLTPEHLALYLKDLRLWGLADYDPNPKKGFFATYAAVVSALPAGRDVGLRSRLEILNSDHLLKICQSLGMTRPPTRKDDRTKEIVALLTDGARCRAVVSRLSQPAQELFAWVRERRGWVSAADMTKQVPRAQSAYGYGYRALDTFWHPTPKGVDLDPLTELVRCALVIPLTPYAGSWYAPSAYAIATEVERAYSGRALLDSGPLRPPPLQPAGQVEGTIPNPANVIRDLGHVLGFIGAGRCEWRQDGLPYKRSLVALGKTLGYKDGTYAETLWDLATGAGLVRPVYGYNGENARYETVPLDESVTTQELFASLLVGWVKAGAAAAPSGVVPVRAQQARTHLLQLLGLLPADTWLVRSSVTAALRFHWPMLFAQEYQPAGTEAPDPGWASLGNLVLGHGTTADGQEAILLPAGHQQLLTPESGATQAALPPWESSWIVQPDRTIVVPPNAALHAVIDLWQIAQLQSSQGASVFRVSAESIAAALNRGRTPTEIREALQRGSKVPLPPTVARMIEDQEKRYGRIKVGAAATYVKVDDPALLEELKRHRKLDKLVWVDVAPGVAFVTGDQPRAVLDSLRQAGYLPVLEEPERPKSLTTVGRTAGAPATRPVQSEVVVRDRRAVVRLANRAMREERAVITTWIDRKGKPQSAELEVIDLHDDDLHAYNLSRGDAQEVMIPLDSIVEATLGDAFLSLDDDDDDDDGLLPPISLLFPELK